MKFQTFLRLAIPVFALGLSMSKAWGGGSNGGGGYSVRCTDGKFYAMDFLATQKEVSDLDPQILQAKHSSEILQRILKRLQEIRPELAVSFADFILMNEKESNVETSRIWINGIHPLEKLTDQQRVRDLRDCLGGGNEADVFQAVIRRQFSGGITYNRDQSQLANLEHTGPLQVSFTYVHEWFRDFTDDADIIMEVNYFIHSKDFFTMKREEIEEVFRRHGLSNLPGSDGIRSSRTVDPLTALKVSWDGVVEYVRKNQNIQVSVYLCPEAKESKVTDLHEYQDLMPDMSSCEKIHETKTFDLPNREGWDVLLSPAAKLAPFELTISGSKINAIANRRVNSEVGPFLTVISKSVMYDGGLGLSVKNSDLSQILNKDKSLMCWTIGAYCGSQYLPEMTLVKDRVVGYGLAKASEELFSTSVRTQFISLIAK